MAMTAEAMAKGVRCYSARRQNTDRSHWARWHSQRPEPSSSMHMAHTPHRRQAPKHSRLAGKEAEEAVTPIEREGQGVMMPQEAAGKLCLCRRSRLDQRSWRSR
jgi:hypothetical protein